MKGQNLMTHEEAEMRMYCQKLVRLGIYDQEDIEVMQWTPANGDQWVRCTVCFWHDTMNQTYPTFIISGTSTRLLLPITGLVRARLRDGTEVKFNGLDFMEYSYKSEIRLCADEKDGIGMPNSFPIVSMHVHIRETIFPHAHNGARELSPGEHTTTLRGVFFCPGINHPDGRRKVLLIVQASSNGGPDYLHHFEKRFVELFTDAYPSWQPFEQNQLPT